MRSPNEMSDADKLDTLTYWLDGVDDGRIIPTRTAAEAAGKAM